MLTRGRDAPARDSKTTNAHYPVVASLYNQSIAQNRSPDYSPKDSVHRPGSDCGPIPV